MNPADYDYCITQEDGEHAVMFRNRAERQERADFLTRCHVPTTLSSVGWPDFNLEEVEQFFEQNNVFLDNLAENQYTVYRATYEQSINIIEGLGFKRVEVDW